MYTDNSTATTNAHNRVGIWLLPHHHEVNSPVHLAPVKSWHNSSVLISVQSVRFILTPVAGLIFETKNRATFLERFFGRGISGEALLPLKLFSHYLAVEWIHFPRIRTFVEKRFHGLFSKKKRSKSGGVPSFPKREHVPAVISLPSGQPTAVDPHQDITG